MENNSPNEAPIPPSDRTYIQIAVETYCDKEIECMMYLSAIMHEYTQRITPSSRSRVAKWFAERYV